MTAVHAPGEPTEKELLEYFETLSNWGRWGADDRLGTVNHITPAHLAEAASLVRSGVTVSCAQVVASGPAPSDVPGSFPPQRFLIRTGQGLGDAARIPREDVPADDRQAAALDYIGYAPHGMRITHLDALSHTFWDRRMYNNRPAERVAAEFGAVDHDVVAYKNGISTRGILIDVARHRGVPWLEPADGVTAAELTDILAATGITVHPGDALLLRTGYARKRVEKGPDPIGTGHAGWRASCLPLFHEWGVALLGADTAQEVMPSGYPSVRLPVHSVGQVAMGMPLLDNADLEELADRCAAEQRWEFFFTLAPVPFDGATGFAVNPLAIF
jgi:kynurenine formamidase